MKSKIFLLAPVVFLAACTTTPQAPTYEWIDLTQDIESTTDYWASERRVQPTYPAGAAARRHAGCVEMAFFINPQGRAENIEVIRSFPRRTFDASGVKALQQWSWVPAAANANNQAVKTTVKLDFNVDGVSNLDAVQEACDSDLRSLFG